METHLTIACNGAGGRVGFEINASRAGPLMRDVRWHKDTAEDLRVSDVADGLAAALRSLVGVPCKRSLTVSSLKLSFDFSQRAKGRVYIWIDPPWRLVCDGRFVTGSYDCPEWDGIEDPEVNRPLWEAWCGLCDPLNDASLVAAIIGHDFPDLRLQFTQGYEVQTFGNDGNDMWWYYRDRLTGECFEASAAGIVRELGQPAEG